MSKKFNNDWASLSKKPELKKKSFDNEKVVEPYRVRRKGVFATMYPSVDGEKYSFAIMPDKDGKSFLMTDIMLVRRFNFTNPNTGEDYYETLKMPMNPEMIFDMSVVDKAAKDPDKLTDDEKTELEKIAEHKQLVKRFKELYHYDDKVVNFKYSKVKEPYTGRLEKHALTAFFGVRTKWKGENVKEKEVKLINTRYVQFQDKFRALLLSTAETHDSLMPDWYEKYFSIDGGVKGIIDVDMGPMAVGGRGASINLVKLGTDPIADAGVGYTEPIDVKSIKTLDGKEHELSHLHYYMGFNSSESLWQTPYVDRIKEALKDLEGHLADVLLEKAAETDTADSK